MTEFLLDTLLDDAVVLDASDEHLLLLVQGRFLIEAREHREHLLLHQPNLHLQPPDMACVPTVKPASEGLARLPRAQSVLGGTPNAVLARVQGVVRAHCRLRVIFPLLVLDAARRAYPEHVFPVGFWVRCVLDKGQLHFWLQDSSARKVMLALDDAALLRAHKALTRVDTEYRWIPMGPGYDHPLFHVPEDHVSAHARMEHQLVLAAYRHELDTTILPLLVA